MSVLAGHTGSYHPYSFDEALAGIAVAGCAMRDSRAALAPLGLS
jgi:hypothetical protein